MNEEVSPFLLMQATWKLLISTFCHLPLLSFPFFLVLFYLSTSICINAIPCIGAAIPCVGDAIPICINAIPYVGDAISIFINAIPYVGDAISICIAAIPWVGNAMLYCREIKWNVGEKFSDSAFGKETFEEKIFWIEFYKSRNYCGL